MAVVAVVAPDCALVRLFLSTGGGLLGLCAVGLAASAGLIGVLLTRGRTRRFAVGFVITGLVAAAFFFAAVLSHPVAVIGVLDGYLGRVLARMPAWLTDGPWLIEESTVTRGQAVTVSVSYPSLGTLLLVEVLIGFPLLAVALAGGLLGLRLRRRGHSTPSSDSS
jgi:hypothetical protein